MGTDGNRVPTAAHHTVISRDVECLKENELRQWLATQKGSSPSPVGHWQSPNCLPVHELCEDQRWQKARAGKKRGEAGLGTV